MLIFRASVLKALVIFHRVEENDASFDLLPLTRDCPSARQHLSITLPDERAGYSQGAKDDDERSACRDPTWIAQDKRKRRMNCKNTRRQQPANCGIKSTPLFQLGDNCGKPSTVHISSPVR